MMVRLFILIAVSFLLVAGLPASAQEAADPPAIIIDGGNSGAPAATRAAQAMENLGKLPQETQERLLNEAGYMESYCQKNVMLGKFYDCACFSLNFIGERIQAGPDTAYQTLLQKGDYKECVSKPSVAGYGYQRCQDILTYQIYTDQQIESICACAGREMASAFAANPVMSIAYTDNLFSSHLNSCVVKETPQQ